MSLFCTLVSAFPYQKMIGLSASSLRDSNTSKSWETVSKQVIEHSLHTKTKPGSHTRYAATRSHQFICRQTKLKAAKREDKALHVLDLTWSLFYLSDIGNSYSNLSTRNMIWGSTLSWDFFNTKTFLNRISYFSFLCNIHWYFLLAPSTDILHTKQNRNRGISSLQAMTNTQTQRVSIHLSRRYTC